MMRYLREQEGVWLLKEDLSGARFFLLKRGAHLDAQVMLKDGRCFGFDTIEEQEPLAPLSLVGIEALFSSRVVFPCIWTGSVSQSLGLPPGVKGAEVYQVEVRDLEGRVHTLCGEHARTLLGLAEMGYRMHSGLPTPEVASAPSPGLGVG